MINGYNSILCGDNDIVIAGGQESMSKAPHAMHMRNGTKLGDAKFVDTILTDGLTDAIYNIHMGDTGIVVPYRKLCLFLLSKNLIN